MGPMTSATNEQLCTQFWNKGFNVFVLYTPYLPLPNPFYLSSDKQYVEPTQSSPALAALQACARYPANFFQASDPVAILAAIAYHAGAGAQQLRARRRLSVQPGAWYVPVAERQRSC